MLNNNIKNKKLELSKNFSNRYTDDILSMNKSNFGDLILEDKKKNKKIFDNNFNVSRPLC